MCGSRLEDLGELSPLTGTKLWSAGGNWYRAPGKRGDPKNGRNDAPQMVVGVAVSRDGVPVPAISCGALR